MSYYACCAFYKESKRYRILEISKFRSYGVCSLVCMYLSYNCYFYLLCLTFIKDSLCAKHVLRAQDYSFIDGCCYYPYLTDKQTKILRN